jgi:Protein of unknown function (DUF3105)
LRPSRARILISALFALAALAVSACGDEEEPTTTAAGATGTTGSTGPSREELRGRAGIDVATGVATGLEPDAREGESPNGLPGGDLERLADEAGCELMLDLRDEGNTHLTPGQGPPDYETEPPTSGDHDAAPTADGAYLETPEITQAVHSLEHGRIAIQYSPELPEQDQLGLKGLFDSDPEGMLLYPNPDQPYEVAATAWTNLIGCDAYSDDALAAIAAFRDRFRGEGPEFVPL